MKRSSIFLRNKLSPRELELLKKDLIDHSVNTALKIKNIGFPREQIEIVVECVGHDLGGGDRILAVPLSLEAEALGVAPIGGAL